MHDYYFGAQRINFKTTGFRHGYLGRHVGRYRFVLAGLRWRYIVLTLAVVAAAAWPMWNYVMHDYQKNASLP